MTQQQEEPKIMKGYEKLLTYNQDQMTQWLILVLSGYGDIPKLTIDESNHLAIIRLSKTLPLLQLILLKKAEIELVEIFCENPSLPEKPYTSELLWLVGEFQHPQSIANIAKLADNKTLFNTLDLKLRQTALSRLAYSKPSQSTDFWMRRVNEDIQYGAIAISAILENDNIETAISIIPRLPDTEKMAAAIKLKLELKWEKISVVQKSLMIVSLQRELKKCKNLICSLLTKWVNDKKDSLLNNKGKHGGTCNRTQCDESPAFFYNIGTHAYYCLPCTIAIREWECEVNPLFENYDENLKEHNDYYNGKLDESP